MARDSRPVAETSSWTPIQGVSVAHPSARRAASESGSSSARSAARSDSSLPRRVRVIALDVLSTGVPATVRRCARSYGPNQPDSTEGTVAEPQKRARRNRRHVEAENGRGRQFLHDRDQSDRQ